MEDQGAQLAKQLLSSGWEVPKILENFVKPVFIKNSKIQNAKLSSGKQIKKRVLDFEDMDESWRGEIMQATSILQWCISQTKPSEVESILGLVIPPILSLIDDYDVKLKTCGVSILEHLLKLVDSETFRRSGLGEALSKCLTYLDEISYVTLIRVSFSTIISLVSLIEPIGTEARYLKYDKILSDNIVKGLTFSGDKLAIRRVLLEQIPRICEELGIVTVKYLQDLIQALCTTLEIFLIVSNNEEILDLHISAAKGLEKIITKCWSRIAQYEGQILKSVATSWYHIIQLEQNDAETLSDYFKKNIGLLKTTLQKICYLLKLACENNHVFKVCRLILI
ncbi:6657_t:CDS:2 [Cetraspora pellucida]|uniref:6657_t:CDS:1 n=1 Tax=Cetraspora pellucida TaxID=1433469 RepID=A0ACA9L5D2_9GLOM|nr:6657_t:CDS:2 [Cetraspora pellucida]